MPDTPQTFDLSKIAVGTFAIFGGAPVDYAKSQILNRCQVPADHPLRAGLTGTHPSERSGPHLPAAFPPEGMTGRLESAQDWLDLIDSVMQNNPSGMQNNQPDNQSGVQATEQMGQATEAGAGEGLPAEDQPHAEEESHQDAGA